MDGLLWLERVLEASVKRRGEVPLTNAHLLNIVRMAQRAKDGHQVAIDKMLSEVLDEDKKWGS